MQGKLVIPALAAILVAGNAGAVDNAVGAQVNNTATNYTSTDGHVNYKDKSLANYQDPYLTNPRGYKSNQFGEAAPAPKPNLFYTETAPSYRESAAEFRRDSSVRSDTDTYIGDNDPNRETR